MGGSQFFLRLLAPSVPVSAGEKSAALPVGSAAVIGGYYNLSLRTTAGSGNYLAGGWSPASVAHYDNFIARFATEPLAAQTIAVDTWTLALASHENNANANSYTVLSLYVYRPSTDTVVGFIYDSDTPLGAEWGLTNTGQVLTFAGAQVVSASGDTLVLEVWRHTAGQAAATAYDHEIYIDGPDPVTAGSTTKGGSYLSTLNSITLAGGGGATIAGTIAMNAPATQISMSGRTSPGRVGTISMAAPSTTISMSGVATLPVAGVGRTFNRGYAYTRSDLEASVLANSSYNTCTLDHGVDPQPAHKEPVIDPVPGDAADTGSTRTLVHIQDPDGVWYTTSIMPPAR